MSEEHEKFRDEMRVCARITEAIDSAAFDHRPFGSFDFKHEDPSLTGRDEDDCDGVIVVRNSDGARFFVEWQVMAQRLPKLEEDPEYIAAHESAEDKPVVDPNQISLLEDD